MRIFYRLTTFLLLPLISYHYGIGQTGRISGKITDASNLPVESATISLLKSHDSSLVKIEVSDKSGNFVFESLKQGSYLFSVSFAGRKTGCGFIDL